MMTPITEIAQMEFHPIADIFPLISGTEYQNLVADIAKNGMIESIWLHPDGRILDGRNRYLACLGLGLKPTTRTYTGELDTLSLVNFVVSLNLKRRHLDSGQRAFVALEIEKVLAEAAKKRQGQRTDLNQTFPKKLGDVDKHQSEAAEQAAQIVGTNRQYVTDAKRMVEQSPDLAQAIMSGEKKFVAARSEHKQRQKQQHQETVKERIRMESLPELVPGKLVLNTVAQCDIAHLDLPEASIDMIFTDPPYHDEHVDLYGDLAQLAVRVLKPGGYLLAYAGKMFLPQVLANMAQHLEYVSIFSVFQPFSQAKIMKHNIFENWRPIVVFKKSGRTATKEWTQDVVRGTRDKEFHDWQQDLEAPLQYIAAYTQPGETVLDPFCGGGTTAAACKTLGRYYIAFDADIEAVKLTLGRLHG